MVMVAVDALLYKMATQQSVSFLLEFAFTLDDTWPLPTQLIQVGVVFWAAQS